MDRLLARRGGDIVEGLLNCRKQRKRKLRLIREYTTYRFTEYTQNSSSQYLPDVSEVT